MRFTTNSIVIAGFLFSLTLLGMLVGLNARHIARMQQAAELVARTHQIQAGLNRLLSLIEGIETGSRGFVITGDPRFLDVFENNVAAVSEQQRIMAQLILNKEQAAELASMESLIAERIAHSQFIVALRRNVGFEAAREQVERGRGKAAMDQIRTRFAQLDANQNSLLEQRSAAATREAGNLQRLTVFGSGLGFFALIFVFALVFNENRLRRRSESQLLANQHELVAAARANRLIMEHSLDVICTIDEAGRFLFVSTACEKLWGYAPEELIGRRFRELVHPEDYAKTDQASAALLEGTALMNFENRYLRKDGSVIPVMWSASWSAEDRIMFCVAHDMTERKKSEDAIELLNAELHRRASQLESTNRELESFSYSVSHDLRAPLRHIEGFASKLQRHLGVDQMDDTTRRLVTTIIGSARTMGRLIDDLLAFSKLGRAELRRSRVNLDELVAESRRALEGEMHGRTITWQVAPLPTVEGDAALLRQVFVNLLGNAVKYSRRCPDARIEVGTQPSQNGEVVIFVRDNGAGFDMKYVDKLFGVFQRLHTASEFEGTGVGLANVQRIVARHGGRVWAEGAVNQGATFFFSLPATKP